MNTTIASKAELIRTINDRCRTHFLGCQVLITPTVQELPDEERTQLLHAVRTFDTFDADNDPHHEHDFGAIDLHGQKWFWKFDYYAPDMRMGSDDPSDANNTRRVLTIMHASEY
jgi:Protein of unknown function (DUF3768)